MLLTEKLSIVIINVILCIAVTSTNTIIVVVAWWSPRNRSSVSIILCLIATYGIATIFLSTIESTTSYITGNLLRLPGFHFPFLIYFDNNVSRVSKKCDLSISVLRTTYLQTENYSHIFNFIVFIDFKY